MKRVVFAPGNGGCTTKQFWFPSVQHELETLGIEVVAAEFVSLELAPPPQEETGISGGKVGLGIGLIALGAGLMWKGNEVWQDEPDRFGRTKNADAYTLYTAAGTFMFFGALSIRGGLKGRGFY